MKNDVNIKTTWLINDKSNYLEIEFYNFEGNYLGIVNVTNKGKVSWSIEDLNYIENIINLVNYVMGEDYHHKLHYETKDEIEQRWTNACIYIKARNLVVNKKYNYENNIAIVNNYTR